MRIPAAVAVSIRSTYGSSSSRMRSSGWGATEPAASRMNISSSTGTPVRSAISANVAPPSAENRSNAWASRKSSVTAPLRMAAPRPSSGMPDATRLLTRPALRR